MSDASAEGAARRLVASAPQPAPAAPSMPGVIAVVGEALMDLVPAGSPDLFQAAPGGSPANVAVGLARLEVPVRLGARLAGDALGGRLRAHLAGNGVDLSYAVRAEEPSSLAIVSVDPGGTPLYDFRVAGTADWQWRAGELVGLIDERVVALHTGSLAAVLRPGADAIQSLLDRVRHQVTISYDPNCRPLLMGNREAVARRVEALVALADVVKVSADDIAWLLPGRSAAEVATAWLARGPALVAITLGPQGVVAAARDTGVVWRSGRPIDVVDTVGAGDAFTSALLAGLYRRNLLGAERHSRLAALEPETMTALLDEAVLASAITCSHHGAAPPTRDSLHAALSR